MVRALQHPSCKLYKLHLCCVFDCKYSTTLLGKAFGSTLTWISKKSHFMYCFQKYLLIRHHIWPVSCWKLKGASIKYYNNSQPKNVSLCFGLLLRYGPFKNMKIWKLKIVTCCIFPIVKSNCKALHINQLWKLDLVNMNNPLMCYFMWFIV